MATHLSSAHICQFDPLLIYQLVCNCKQFVHAVLIQQCYISIALKFPKQKLKYNKYLLLNYNYNLFQRQTDTLFHYKPYDYKNLA